MQSKEKIKRKKTPLSLRKFNNALSVLLIIISIYIMFSPLFPELSLLIKKHTDETKGLVYVSKLADEAVSKNEIPSEAKEKLKPIPKVNTLVIPSIGVDSEIFEGATSDTLYKGIWRRPNSSTPRQGGNTVIVAHRYLYTEGPNTFYHLDKVKKGDKFIIFWNGKEYDYEVFETKVVPPTATEIEDKTTEPIVTLYTCTPLWTAKNRLVVRGKLVEKSDSNNSHSDSKNDN